jgi:1-deoxy-D-xylulose-5-phosphate reductoisomerase
VIGVTILGSTGSIGVSTLDVLARHADRYQVLALAAWRSVDKLYQQCMAVHPRFAVLADPHAAQQLADRLRGTGIEVLSGNEGLEWVAAHPEAPVVMAAIVGAAGLLPAMAAVRAGKRLLLANKEALVVSGRLFMDEAARCGAEILPIDSEHNAVFQCLPAERGGGLVRKGVEKILLTASGGPFRGYTRQQLLEVTPEQACAHPNWSMGRKISVDSATLMNKGLEVIEACWLFQARPRQIEVVVHPQSVIHSMVQYLDGSVLAQLSQPDMRLPIAYALGWPERMAAGVDRLDLAQVGRLDFERPDLEGFPCLRLAYQAIEAGGALPAVLNAANEVAVAAFLDRRLRFVDIPRLIEQVMGQFPAVAADDLTGLLRLDQEVRQMAFDLLESGFGA